jgi:hypothetical protein
MYLQKAHPSTSVPPVSGFQNVDSNVVGITGQWTDEPGTVPNCYMKMKMIMIPNVLEER